MMSVLAFVTHGAGEYPADMCIGEVQGASELAFEGRPAMRDRVALEETGSVFYLSCPTDLYRIRQQW